MFRIVLVIGPVLLFINASCPDGETAKNWAARLKKHAADTITADEHRYAAVLVEKLNRKFEKVIVDLIGLTLKPLGYSTKFKKIPDGLAIFLVLCGPLIVINSIQTPESTIVSIIHYLFYLSTTLFISTFVGGHSDFGGIQLKNGQVWLAPNKCRGWRKVVVFIGLLQTNAKATFSVTDANGEAQQINAFRISDARIKILTFVVAFSLLVYVVSAILSVPELPPLWFFGVYVPFGLYFSLLCSCGVLLAIYLPFMMRRGNSRSPARKKIRLLLITTISMYVSTILVFLSRYEGFFHSPPDSFRIILTNVICDLYVYWRFQQFIWLVRTTRRKSASVRRVVLIDFLYLIFWSCIMSLVSIYVGFLWTEQQLSLVQSVRLFFGLHAFEDTFYFGLVFWLVHTTFLPVTVFCLIPVCLILGRFSKMVYNNIITKVSVSQNPLLYLASVVSLLAALRGLFT